MDRLTNHGERLRKLRSHNSRIQRHFSRQRLDIGMNTQFKVNLTAKDDKLVYTQGLPVPINFKEALMVSLASPHAQIRDHHDATFLKIRKPYLCPTEAQQLVEATGGSAQDQRAHRR